MNWTNDDILLVEKFIDIKNKGYYADGAQLTEVYNRVLDKRVSATNCGSCIRGRISELEEALNRFKRMSEAKVEDTPQDENKAVGNASSLHSNTIGMSRKAGKKK